MPLLKLPLVYHTYIGRLHVCMLVESGFLKLKEKISKGKSRDNRSFLDFNPVSRIVDFAFGIIRLPTHF